MTMRLSENFTLDELLRNSGASAPPDRVVIAAQHTADVLQAVRRQLGDKPMIVTSWYRTPAKNAEVGGAPTSAHLNGYGVDFYVPGMTTREVVNSIAAHVRQLRIDQVIDERDHVHLSADPRARGHVLLEPSEGEFVRVQSPQQLPPVTVTAAAPGGNNAKIIAIITAAAAILEAVRRLLSQ